MRLRAEPRRFLVTGVAGFIGSHLLETLLRLEQNVVGLDNFATGSRENLSEVLDKVGPKAASRFRFVKGDIREPSVCRDAMTGVQVILHQAALASVPRSIEEPMTFHSVNVDGFLNLLLGARSAGIQRIVYASSSAVYGDDLSSEKTEDRIGRPLSPYAATKLIDEIYAGTFRRSHGISSVGLRYFNVFGPRQDPTGPYAAVIPRWIEQLLCNEQCVAFGDGTASRDFCSVDDVVQANLLASRAPEHDDSVFNVGSGTRTTLLELFELIRDGVAPHQLSAGNAALRFDPPRAGDIQHSLASIAHAREGLGYEPSADLALEISETIAWHASRMLRSSRAAPQGIAPTLRSEHVT
ncbi:MAG TPA: NAD-dependent epimerase/dehydratase family protein [Polyangiaceae bacterium]|nr:NAD-dependent epimerase/dehydratase family protein [Polyangiaceae bacterium]